MYIESGTYEVKRKKMAPVNQPCSRLFCRKVATAREKKGFAQYQNVAKNVLALPDDHYLSYKSVKKWIKTQQEIARSERRNMVKSVKGAICKDVWLKELYKSNEPLYPTWRLVL